MVKFCGQRKLSLLAIVVSTSAVGWGLAVAPTLSADAAAAPAPPFTECPAIGDSPSCEILLAVNANNTVSVESDPSVGPFDGSDDTLVGIINNSATAVKAITVIGPGSDLSGFDGDGICSGDYGDWAGSAGCPYGPTGYEGPGTSFVTDPSLPDSAEVDFAGGLAPGRSAYFSLEGALTAAALTAHKGGLSTFTVSGSDKSTVGQAGKEATGSPEDAKRCESLGGQVKYAAAEALGLDAVEHMQEFGLTNAWYFLDHFLGGTGTPINLPDTSLAASEIKESQPFKDENNGILNYIQQQLDSGVTNISLPAPGTVHAFAFLNPLTDLYYALRRTHEVQVIGGGSLIGGNYVGWLKYVISESYGFNSGNTLLGAGPAMRYLQTVCGAPYFPGGAHWFKVSVTITESLNLPGQGPVSTHSPGDARSLGHASN